MAKIAKRLPKAKEVKLRMEVSKAELAYLSEVETIKLLLPQEPNQNQILSHQNIRHYQNQSSLFQPPISRSFVEESNSRPSSSTYSKNSNQLIGTNYSHIFSIYFFFNIYFDIRLILN